MSVLVYLSKVTRNGLIKAQHSYFRNIIARQSSLWEPDYLILAKTKTPEYDLINVQIKGSDYPILENYQKCIHRLAKIMDIDVENSWATPHQDFVIKTYLPKSTVVVGEYKMKFYERNIQVIDVKSHIMALFIEAVITTCPVGVKLSIHEHKPEMEEIRYIPDFDIIDLKKQLDEIKKPKK